MRSRFWLSLIAISLLMTGAMAQDVPLTLTEADAVQLALQRQPMLRAAQAEAGMAQARANQAQADAKLQVSGNALATASTMRNVLAAPTMPQALLQTQDRTSLDVNGMAMLPLYTGGRIQSSTRAARLTASASLQGVTLARTQIAFAARTRFAAWQQALAMLIVAQDTVTAQTTNTQVTQQLFDVGKVPQFDLLRAKAAQAAAQQQAANAQADVTAARAQLAQALGVPVATIPASPAVEALPAPPTNTIATALATRPDLLAAQQTINAALATVDARKGNSKPQIYAVGMVDALAPADMGKSAGLTVGVVAGIPLFDGGRRKAEVGEAEQAVAQARANRDALELQVRADVAGADARVTAARQNIDTATAQMAAAEEAYTVAQARYAGGKGTIVELLDAQRALTEARQSPVTAQAQYRGALATLYQAMGLDVLASTTPAS
ncbi:MAG TPA: TolC family protein [Armatimonadota bacterium]|jgi:outer membrane protein TolC